MAVDRLEPPAPPVGEETADPPSGSPPSGAPGPGWATAAVLGALVAGHVAVQVGGRMAPRWGDAMLTMRYARDFPDVPADHHSTRLGVVLPARALQDVLGFGEYSYYLYPAAMGLLVVVATFFLARTLFGLAAAAAAGAIMVFSPVLGRGGVTTTSWHLLPDVPATGWLTLAVALLVSAATRAAGSAGGLSGRWQIARFVTAGLAFGLAYTCREFVAATFVVIPLVFLLYRLPWRRLLVVAAPMAGVLAAEMAVSWWAWGDPLVRLSVTGGHGGAPAEPQSRFDTITDLPATLVNMPHGWVLVALMALTVVGALVFRERGLLVLAAWFVAFAAPLMLLGGLLDPDHISLRVHLARYWVAILPPTAVGGVGAVVLLARALAASRARAWGGSVAARAVAVALVGGFLAWYAVPVVRFAHDNPNDASWDALRGYLDKHDDQLPKLSSDYRTADMLEMYSHDPVGGDLVWHGRTNIFNALDAAGFYHKLDRVPTPEEVGGGALLYSQQTARRPPRRADGWVLAFRKRAVRVYVPEGSELARGARR